MRRLIASTLKSSRWRLTHVQCKTTSDIRQAHHDRLHGLLDSKRLDAIFKTIGTNITQLEANTQLLPLSVPQSEIKTFVPPFLKQITRLLTRAAPW